ncbi:MAG: hypothetical protein KJ066_03885 [Acidobacteria bacterium]|nr:hypothetical protein [Acidobacteriota bacterium]
MIDSGLAAFLEGGLSIHLGTRDAHLQPNGVRAAALRVEDAGTHLTVYVAKVAAARVLSDLRSNGQAAVVVCRPTDDRSCQVKGHLVSVRTARADERAIVASQWDGFLEQLALIGIPRATTEGWTTWPAVAIRLRATALFDQTPGPGAGAPLS